MTLLEHLQKIDISDINSFIRKVSISVELFNELNISFDSLPTDEQIKHTIDVVIIYLYKHFTSIMVIVYNVYNVYKIISLFIKKIRSKRQAEKLLRTLSGRTKKNK